MSRHHPLAAAAPRARRRRRPRRRTGTRHAHGHRRPRATVADQLEQLDLARTQLEVARAQLGRTDQSLAVQRRLAANAEQTLQHAKEINQKTAKPTGANSVVAALVTGLDEVAGSEARDDLAILAISPG